MAPDLALWVSGRSLHVACHCAPRVVAALTPAGEPCRTRCRRHGPGCGHIEIVNGRCGGPTASLPAINQRLTISPGSLPGQFTAAGPQWSCPTVRRTYRDRATTARGRQTWLARSGQWIPTWAHCSRSRTIYVRCATRRVARPTVRWPRPPATARQLCRKPPAASTSRAWRSSSRTSERAKVTRWCGGSAGRSWTGCCATAPRPRRRPDRAAFTGTSYLRTTNVRRGASLDEPVIGTVSAGCTLGFTSYCLGQKVYDATARTPDIRWFQMADGGLVASAVIHGNPPASLGPTLCRGARPAPAAIALTVISDSRKPGSLVLRESLMTVS